MANIKVSEMTEATTFDDGDYTMIVQANQNKKISKENIFSSLEDEIDTIATDISTINTNIGNLANLTTPIKTDLVNAINSIIETGSNENGTYVKYSDGTLLQYGNYTVNGTFALFYNMYATGKYRITYPIEFVEPTNAIVTCVGVEGGWIVSSFASATISESQEIRFMRATGRSTGTETCIANWIAVGKWK